MELYTGRGKKLKVSMVQKVTIDGQEKLVSEIYKIMDAAYDMAQAYAAEIKTGTKTINDVPDDIKALVQALLE